MTLANKVSCKDNHFKRHTRSDGFEFLYVSQMKNNDKEMDQIIDNLKKNHPKSEIEKYSLRRTQSNQIFRDPNEIPFTHPPDHFFIQNKLPSNPSQTPSAALYIDPPQPQTPKSARKSIPQNTS